MRPARSALLIAGLWLMSAAASAAGIPVRGRVLDAGGAPLAKVRVRLVPITSAHAAGLLALDGREPEPVASVETSADGGFLLQAPDIGMWKVVAGGSGGGLVPQEASVLPLLGELDLPVVRLQKDAGLTVRVSGPDGKPVAGARVQTQAESPSRGRFSPWRTVPGQALTDAEGRAVLPRSGAVTVRAGASDRVAVERKEVRTATLELRLGIGQTVPVRVLAADGKPVAGVLMSRQDGLPLGTTDDQGVLALAVGEKPPLDVTLLAADGRTFEARVALFRPGEPRTPRELRLPALVEIPARVTSAADGRPLTGALVWSDPGSVHRTDARGETRLATPAAGPWGAQAAAPGHATDSFGRLQAGPRRPLSFALEPDLAVTGVVVDEAGRPVAGAEISASAANWPMRMPMRSRMRLFQGGSLARTGPDGRFRVGNLVEGISYELRATRAGFAPARAETIAPSPERPAVPVRIVLQRGRSAFGKVLDAEQRPVAGAQVTLRSAAPTDRMRQLRALDEEILDLFETATGADGRFDLRNLPPGRYDLMAWGRGFAPLTLPNLEIPEGAATTDLGTLVLAPGVALEGRVVDDAGKPVEGAQIHVAEAADDAIPFRRPRETAEPQGMSALDGFFRIEDLRAGSAVDVTALRTGHAPGEAQGVRVPADEPVRIVLLAVATLSGRVLDPDGRPIPNASVGLHIRPRAGRGLGGRLTYSTSGGAPLFGRSDADGNFRLTDVAPGVVGLWAVASGWQSGEVSDLELRAGEEKTGVEIVLSPAAFVEGRVLSPSGRPVPGAEVQLTPEAGPMSMVASAGTDGDGRYQLDGVPPGRRTVEATHPDYGTGRREADLRAGENSLDIALEAGSEVTGRVVDDAGAPVASASVVLRKPGSFQRLEATSGADGSFRIAAVPDGSYDARATKEGFAPSESVQVTVTGGSAGSIELRLARGGAIVGRILGVETADLARLRIMAQGGRGMPSIGRVEPDASYRIDNLREGEWQVRAELPGTGLYAEGTVRLEPGASEARLDLEMKRGLELSGRVRRNGVPASGQPVSLRGAGMAMSQTDADGRFRFEGLPAGSYVLQLVDSFFRALHEEPVELEADREITIDLTTGDITGRVVDAAGAAPLEGVTVELLRAGGGAMGGTAQSDSRGLFVLRGVAEGSWRLRAQLDGYTPAEVDVQVSRERAEDVEIALQATEGVTLQLATASGPPPASLFYMVLDGAGRKIADGRAVVGEEGRVRLARVPPGRWDLLLFADALATTELAVTAPGDAGRLTLAPACTLRVTVRALAESPVAAQVSLTGAGGRPYRAMGLMTEPAAAWDLRRGTHTLSRVPPGTWTIQVTAADGRTWRGTVTTAPGVEAEAVLD